MKALLIVLLCAMALGAFAILDPADDKAFAEEEDAIPNDQINDGEGQSDTDDDNDDNDENSQVAEIEDDSAPESSEEVLSLAENDASEEQDAKAIPFWRRRRRRSRRRRRIFYRRRSYRRRIFYRRRWYRRRWYRRRWYRRRWYRRRSFYRRRFGK